jgi:hypothetical protein
MTFLRRMEQCLEMLFKYAGTYSSPRSSIYTSKERGHGDYITRKTIAPQRRIESTVDLKEIFLGQREKQTRAKNSIAGEKKIGNSDSILLICMYSMLKYKS